MLRFADTLQMQEGMKAKDEALALVEEEKIKEKQREIKVMHRRLSMLNKKHDLIKKKLEKMEGFAEFTKKISAQNDSIADRSELLQRYFT